jgi:DNA-binding GntR family transcriptional regulator
MEKPAIIGLDRRTTAEQIASVLRKRIFAGMIEPGKSVREIPLAEMLGVSRNTLREALRSLAMEGLIQHSLHRGVTVTLLLEEDITDIYRTREHIELLAVNAIGSNAAREAKLEPMREALDQMKTAEQKGDWQALADADLEFHAQLVALLGRPRLNVFFRKMFGELRLALILHDSATRMPVGYLKSHRLLYDLLLSGNKQECRAALIDHLAEAETALKNIVAEVSRKREPKRATRSGDGAKGESGNGPGVST